MNKISHKYLAYLWLLVVSVLFIYNGYLWLDKKISLNSNILALLPAGQRDPLVQTATDHMFNTVQQQIAVLVGANTWGQAVKAADAYTAVIKIRPDIIKNTDAMITNIQNNYLEIFSKSRLGLLTNDQQVELNTQPSQYWENIALSDLYNPFSGPKLGAWQDDPFGLFSGWVQKRAEETPVRPREGKLFVADKNYNYVVLLMQVNKPAFSMSTQKSVMPLLDAAKLAAKKAVPESEIISTGVILHAAYGSQEASHEMSTIAVGSIIGIILLMWLLFRSLKPILLIGLSISIGCLGALSISWILLGQIHLLTLVFGASLIGIAQDYAIYFLCNRLGANNNLSSPELLKYLYPGLSLTLLAALLGYMGLALTPFPGLRQMALFSGLGLIFAWLTVVCWFPVLINPQSLKATKLSKYFETSLTYWPRFKLNKFNLLISLIFLIFIILGFFKLTISDDIRSLQKPPQNLINDQIKLNKILDSPTFVQFYLIRGETAQIVLKREELLKFKLQDLIKQKIITGTQAVSNWVPSAEAQIKNQALIKQKLLSNQGPLKNLANKIGEDNFWIFNLRNHLLKSSVILTPEVFINSSVSEPWRYLWLGKVGENYASIVVLRGLNNYDNLSKLKNIASNISGVQWVDKISEISSILGYYRQTMGWVICCAYIAIYLLLYIRYRAAAWRVLMPPFIASISTIAVFGLLGVPLQLFQVLAFMLILGLGVDYGIFLQEATRQSDRQHNSYPWLTVGLSAISALLSFGLLGLSQTPPLHAFGMTMLIGMTLVWLIAPCFRKSVRL